MTFRRPRSLLLRLAALEMAMREPTKQPLQQSEDESRALREALDNELRASATRSSERVRLAEEKRQKKAAKLREAAERGAIKTAQVVETLTEPFRGGSR